MSAAWPVSRIADLCERIDYGFTASAAQQPIGPRFLRITDIVGGPIDWSSVPYCAVSSVEAAKFALADGDIVVARTGATTGASAYVKEPPESVFASYLVRLRVSRDADARFVAYFLRSQQYWSYVRGVLGDKSAQPNASAKTLTRAELRVPPLSTQRAIAGVLGVLDDKIELNRRTSETLAQLAVEHFRREYWQSPDREAWAEERLDSHLDVVRGLSYTGAGLTADGLPLHNLNSIYEGGGYKRTGLKRYSGEYKERHVVRAGEVIVANTDLTWNFQIIASPAMIPGEDDGTGLFSHHLYRVRPKEASPLTPVLVYLLLRAGPLRTEVAGYANGTTVNMLPQDALQKPLFRVPPPELARKLDELVTPLFARAESAETESETLAELRDALLPKLISGELRVRDVDAIAESADL